MGLKPHFREIASRTVQEQVAAPESGYKKNYKIYIVLLSTALVVNIIGFQIILKNYVNKSFATLEDHYIENSWERFENILKMQKASLSKITSDYSSWNSMYAYVNNQNREFEQDVFVLELFTNFTLNIALIFDKDKNLIFKSAFDFNTESELNFEEFKLDRKYDKSVLMPEARMPELVSFYNSSNGPMLFCSYPILHSDDTGPVNGYFIFGRLIDRSFTGEISDLCGGKVIFYELPIINKSGIQKRLLEILRELNKAGNADYISRKEPGIISVYSKIRDVDGKPLFLVEVIFKRRFITEAGTIINYLMTVAFVLSVVLAGVIAALIERKRSEKETRAHLAKLRKFSNQLATIEEKSRRTFAKTLHDQITQNLAAISMGLTKLRRLASPEDQNLLSKVADIKSLLDATISSTRNLTADLFPSLLDDMGLIAALSWHAEVFGNRYDIKVSINSDELKKKLSHETELILFRTVQEALHNVAKHARATKVEVSFKQKGKNLQLTISDDGVGFDPGILATPGKGSGIGLILMKEKVASLGGIFEIDSSKGTTIRIKVPLIEE